jgi:hypothetical protein
MNLAESKPAELLFLLRNPAYVRNFEPILRAIARDGHRATVLFEEHKQGADRPGLARLDEVCADHPSLSYEFIRPMPLGPKGTLRKALRIGQDYLRYFDPPYESAELLRARATPFVPRSVERVLAAAFRRLPRLRHTLSAAARRLDRALGADPGLIAELRRRDPTVLIVSPQVHFGSRQNGWVRAAKRVGIRTALCIHGWDNLTNTGLIHELPDRILAWNETQRRQAVELHGAQPGSVLVTGAWPYDHWFGWEVSRSRDELCRELGLDPERPIILYACSSRFIAEHERDSVTRWIEALRSASDERLAGANVIVRPHPLNRSEWVDPGRAPVPGATVFPPNGADPVSDRSKADYFDSVAHADAVVGVNTSALIESAIVDRPALAFPAPEFRASQDELPHFRELTGEHGVVGVSASMHDHLARLVEVLVDSSVDRAERQRFVERFIRPHGAAPAPTELAVAAIEDLIGEGAATMAP